MYCSDKYLLTIIIKNKSTRRHSWHIIFVYRSEEKEKK